MAGLTAAYLLLLFPLSCSQSTLQSEQEISPHQAPAAPPPAPPPHIQDILRKEESAHLNAKRTCKCCLMICGDKTKLQTSVLHDVEIEIENLCIYRFARTSAALHNHFSLYFVFVLPQMPTWTKIMTRSVCSLLHPLGPSL